MARRGMGIRQIARELGCSRNTVRRYVYDARASRYGPRDTRPTKLDAFKAYVAERIAAAKPHWIPAVVLLREIRALGYDGGLTQLKMFINPLETDRGRPGGSLWKPATQPPFPAQQRRGQIAHQVA